MDFDPASYLLGTKAAGGGGGGGGSPDLTKPVKFIDYDGTILYSYTAQEIQALTELPSLPTHQRLVAQGWNWILSDIKAYMTTYPTADLIIGAVYITASGDTEIDITISSLERNSPYLNIGLDGEVSIDWGDSSTLDTLSSDDLESTVGIQHTYSAIGNYTITIHTITGGMSIVGGQSSRLLGVDANSPSSAEEDYIYSRCINAVYIGNDMSTIKDYAFTNCYNLSVVTIPNSVITIGYNAFKDCASLYSIIIPSGITDILELTFSDCYSLSVISLPNTIETIEDNVFSICHNLQYISIPSSVTSIGDDCFDECHCISSLIIPNLSYIGSYSFSNLSKIKNIIISGNITDLDNATFAYDYSLISVILPNGLTSLGEDCFYACYNISSITIPNGVTEISTGAFSNCYSLSSITLPSNITNIASNIFYCCYGLKSIHMLATTPPTLSGPLSTESIPDLVIYVPTASVNAYKAASGWSNYASIIVGE